MLDRTGANLPDDDPTRLSRYVRDVVGTFFADCDAAITGANAVVAGSGRIVIVENEGNVSLGVSHPALHIVITGIEKVVADEAAALSILQVLAANATAQPLTAFSHFLAEPAPGQQRHVVFLDNGRSRILADPRYRDVLRCIRCSACMNSCPVYRTAGGLSYGSSYMGPIGAVLSPLLWRDGRYADLPFASACSSTCAPMPSPVASAPAVANASHGRPGLPPWPGPPEAARLRPWRGLACRVSAGWYGHPPSTATTPASFPSLPPSTISTSSSRRRPTAPNRRSSRPWSPPRRRSPPALPSAPRPSGSAWSNRPNPSPATAASRPRPPSPARAASS
jgi:ferredoxin